METIKQNGIIGGNDVGVIAENLPIAKGTYLVGDLLQLNETMELEKCTTVEKFIGVVPDDLDITKDGETATVYLTGRFDLKELLIPEGFDLTKLKYRGRELGIFFAE